MTNKTAGAFGPAAIAIAVMLGLPAHAQEEAQTPELDLSTGEVIGATDDDASYTGATHGDWELVCMRAEEGEDPCQMYQLLRDADGNATAEITLFPLPEGQEAVAGATVLTPLETLFDRAACHAGR